MSSTRADSATTGPPKPPKGAWLRSPLARIGLPLAVLVAALLPGSSR